MEIPKFHETFIPILKILKNGQLIKVSELPIKILEEKYFVLNKEQLSEKTTTGSRLFFDRVHWGKTYLKQARFIEQPERGYVKITQKGLDILKNNKNITLDFLKKDEDYIEHQKRSVIKKGDEKQIKSEDITPQDMIDLGFKDINFSLKNNVFEKLKEIDPYYFEKVVLILFQKMGYGDFEETPKSGDGGIDGIINQDQLGIDKIYIQAKRYNETKIRETSIRNFIGAMAGDTNKGIFVTTSKFDESAIKKANDANHKIILIDGERLVDLMIKYNVGIQLKANYEVKEIDDDFFEAD